MGKVAKFLIGLLVGLILVLVISLSFTIIRGEEVIRTQLETEITEALGTTAQIASLNLNPITGMIQVRSLQVNNPPGLTTPYFMKIGDIDITVKPLSLLQEVVQIQELTLRNWEINIEQTLTKGNMFEIISHIQKQEKGSESPDKLGNTKKVSAGKITVEKVNTLFKLSFLNQSFDRNFIVESFDIKDITSDNAPAILLNAFIRRIMLQTSQIVMNQAKESIKQIIPSFPGNLPDLPFLKVNPLDSLQELLNSISHSK